MLMRIIFKTSGFKKYFKKYYVLSHIYTPISNIINIKNLEEKGIKRENIAISPRYWMPC